MLTLLVAIGSLFSTAAGARDNRAGLAAWKEGDTSTALKRLAKAARDTSDPRFAYNLGTVRSLARAADADTAFTQALKHARTDAERARILYNRGTDRLQASQAGGACPNPAIEDLRASLRLRPGWKEAARNLELALRLRKQQEDQKKDQDKKKDPKENQKDQKDKKDPKDSQDKDDKSAQKPPSPKPNQMDKNDAERLLNAAQAKEGSDMKKPKTPGQGVGNGPDW
ncbi:MAG TPA: hypothetical protein PKO15_11485 [Fibrobacteria bacterium]|nr:hypothetical protein [Fibrobacteria bacterium]HOX50419.1 hypothetical protein [Fibrobacteria bacterium]